MTRANNSSMKNQKKPHKKPIKSIQDLRDRYAVLKDKPKYDRGKEQYDHGKGSY